MRNGLGQELGVSQDAEETIQALSSSSNITGSTTGFSNFKTGLGGRKLAIIRVNGKTVCVSEHKVSLPITTRGRQQSKNIQLLWLGGRAELTSATHTGDGLLSLSHLPTQINRILR